MKDEHMPTLKSHWRATDFYWILYVLSTTQIMINGTLI